MHWRRELTGIGLILVLGGCGGGGSSPAGPDGRLSWHVRHVGISAGAMWGSSGDDVFAVGEGGTILHFDGGGWTATASGTDEFLAGVWGSSGSDVFAVGGNATIVHYGP